MHTRIIFFLNWYEWKPAFMWLTFDVLFSMFYNIFSFVLVEYTQVQSYSQIRLDARRGNKYLCLDSNISLRISERNYRLPREVSSGSVR